MKAYRSPVGAGWWLKRRPYFFFMLRELTSVLIGAFLVFFILHLFRLDLFRLGSGMEEYARLLDRLRSPGWVLFHLLALAAALYHTITWFNLTPKAIVVRLGEERVPPSLIAGANYIVWIMISVGIVWVVAGR
jgi:fumarate reductase subunit C